MGEKVMEEQINKLEKSMSSTSTTKKNYEKILKKKRIINILFEIIVVSIGVIIAMISLVSNDNNVSTLSSIYGLLITIFIIYNKQIINIEEILFKNRISYLEIDKLFSKLPELRSLENNPKEQNKSYLELYLSYQNSISIVENLPDFIFNIYYIKKTYDKSQKKWFKTKGFIKLIYYKFISYVYILIEYIIEILIIIILFQVILQK